jgi:hypothetical protein
MSLEGCDFEARLSINLEALGRRFPELAALVAESLPSELEASVAASGEMSARGPGGQWLHSSRDPRSEASRLAAACLAPGVDAVVLLGLGLGYGAEAILSGGLDAGIGRLLVCEAEASALNAAFRIRDLSALLSDERLGFIVGGEPEGLISALELSEGTKAGILELKAATICDPEWFGRARSAAERWNAKGRVNENTLKRFGRLWVRNLAANLGQAASSLGVDSLEGLFSSFPAIVLAAGPSLDLVLPSIREISRRAVVICVDTSLRSLLRSGLEPDFLVVVDPQYWNWRHLGGLSSPSSILVSETAAWPAVFRSDYRAVFLGGSLFPLGQRIESFAGAKGRLGAGGSVATSAWDLGRILGASPLWMAGLDLSYPGGRTHAKASLFEQRALSVGDRLQPASSSQAAALVGGASFEAPASDGTRVRTDQRMSLYAWWFESRFTRPSSPKTISLSPSGLAIPGLVSGSLEELLSYPDRRSEIDELISRAAALGPPAGSREKLSVGLDSLLSQLESIARTAEAARSAASEGHVAFASHRDCSPYLAALEEADKALLDMEARDIAGFLLPPLAELAGLRPRDLGESFVQSEGLYGNLAGSARYHMEILDAYRES